MTYRQAAIDADKALMQYIARDGVAMREEVLTALIRHADQAQANYIRYGDKEIS